MTIKRQKRILNALGFRTNTYRRRKQAVRNFQRGWNLGNKLIVDGIVGPETEQALETSYDKLKRGEPTMSARFSYSEFACHCGGRYYSCKRIYVHRALVRGLEGYRDLVDGSVTIISGYRCKRHNSAVGGASRSQHKYGRAADVPPRLTLGEVKRAELFSGIGFNRRDAKVRHVDVRTNATPQNPTTWAY